MRRNGPPARRMTSQIRVTSIPRRFSTGEADKPGVITSLEARAIRADGTGFIVLPCLADPGHAAEEIRPDAEASPAGLPGGLRRLPPAPQALPRPRAEVVTGPVRWPSSSPRGTRRPAASRTPRA